MQYAFSIAQASQYPSDLGSGFSVQASVVALGRVYSGVSSVNSTDANFLLDMLVCLT